MLAFSRGSFVDRVRILRFRIFHFRLWEQIPDLRYGSVAAKAFASAEVDTMSDGLHIDLVERVS